MTDKQAREDSYEADVLGLYDLIRDNFVEWTTKQKLQFVEMLVMFISPEIHILSKRGKLKDYLPSNEKNAQG